MYPLLLRFNNSNYGRSKNFIFILFLRLLVGCRLFENWPSLGLLKQKSTKHTELDRPRRKDTDARSPLLLCSVLLINFRGIHHHSAAAAAWTRAPACVIITLILFCSSVHLPTSDFASFAHLGQLDRDRDQGGSIGNNFANDVPLPSENPSSGVPSNRPQFPVWNLKFFCLSVQLQSPTKFFFFLANSSERRFSPHRTRCLLDSTSTCTPVQVTNLLQHIVGRGRTPCATMHPIRSGVRPISWPTRSRT